MWGWFWKINTRTFEVSVLKSTLNSTDRAGCLAPMFPHSCRCEDQGKPVTLMRAQLWLARVVANEAFRRCPTASGVEGEITPEQFTSVAPFCEMRGNIFAYLYFLLLIWCDVWRCDEVQESPSPPLSGCRQIRRTELQLPSSSRRLLKWIRPWPWVK